MINKTRKEWSKNEEGATYQRGRSDLQKKKERLTKEEGTTYGLNKEGTTYPRGKRKEQFIREEGTTFEMGRRDPRTKRHDP